MGNSFELGNDKMNWVDIKSVEIISSNYLKDKSHVYFKYMQIKNADPASFEILCLKNNSFARDKNMIYFEGHAFKDLDLESVQFAGGKCGCPILKDKNHLYSTFNISVNTDENYIISPVQNVNPDKYQYLNDFYGKDDKVGYYKCKPIEGSDAQTFNLLGEFARDSNCVYYNGLPVKEIDPATFTLIKGGGYTKDRNGVYLGLNSFDDKNGQPIYFTPKIVVGADPESFVMIPGEKIDYAKDKEKYYWGGKAQ